jgi:hypothetical protein
VAHEGPAVLSPMQHLSMRRITGMAPGSSRDGGGPMANTKRWVRTIASTPHAGDRWAVDMVGDLPRKCQCALEGCGLTLRLRRRDDR